MRREVRGRGVRGGERSEGKSEGRGGEGIGVRGGKRGRRGEEE